MLKRYWINQLNTTDLDRLLAFYKETLGFVEEVRFRPNPGTQYPQSGMGDLLGTGAPERMIMLRIPGDVVRLLIFESVSYTHLPSPRDLSTSRMPSSA